MPNNVMRSPFMLEYLMYTVQRCEANPDFDREAENTLDWEQFWTFSLADDRVDDRLFAILKINSQSGDQGNTPFDIELETFAGCNVAGWGRMTDADKASAEIQVRQIVTGMARERIRMLTADAPWGPVIIPPLPVS